MSLAGAWKQLRWSSDYGQGPKDWSRRTDQQCSAAGPLRKKNYGWWGLAWPIFTLLYSACNLLYRQCSNNCRDRGGQVAFVFRSTMFSNVNQKRSTNYFVGLSTSTHSWLSLASEVIRASLPPTCFTSSLEPASYISLRIPHPNCSSPSQRPSLEHADFTYYTLPSPSISFSLFYSELKTYFFRKSYPPL